jgi:cysteine desulfurase
MLPQAAPGRPAYLDYNATAPVRPQAVQAMTDALAEVGNPSSVHAGGRRARALIEGVRRELAACLAVEATAVVFTSGGTEANHLALLGVEGPLLVSAVEHPSVLGAVLGAATAPVDGAGRLDLAAFEALLATVRPRLVSIMLANNETGVVQPLAEAAALARAAGALVHTDAVQVLGKLPLDLDELGVDLLSVSAHKLGGPPGVGALVVREGVELRPLLRGGGQELRRRSGTENLPGIAGFGAALGVATDWAAVRALRDRLESAILEGHPATRIVGVDVPRLPNTSCLLTPDLTAETQLIALDLAGVAVSSGSACSSGKVGPSHVLAAMGLPEADARCAIRLSLGWATTEADVDRFLEAWTDLVRRRRAG